MSEVYVHQDEQETTKKAPYLRIMIGMYCRASSIVDGGIRVSKGSEARNVGSEDNDELSETKHVCPAFVPGISSR